MNQMKQVFSVLFLNEEVCTFINAGLLLDVISNEPFGENRDMIDLLKKFTQLLMNDFALNDYFAKCVAPSVAPHRRT